MLGNHLKVTIRRLIANKTATFINFSGLTVGLAAALLIGLYVLNEWQTDRALPLPERTYRLLRVSEINNEPYDIGVTSAPFAEGLKEDFSEIEETVRTLDGNSLITIGEKKFDEPNYYYVDPNFLTFFGLPMLYGDPATALSHLHSIVLTHETALRYFGSAEKAMGQTIRIDNSYDATVSGVLAKQTAPTHFQFDLLESNLELRSADWWKGWWNNALCTYIRLKPGVTAAELEPFFPAFMDKYFGKDFSSGVTRIGLRLQPLREVYFENDTRYDPMQHGDWTGVQVFLFAALLLVVIACANYINLSTAKAVERSREVGIRKVLGSSRRTIIWQMLSESFLLTIASVTGALLLVRAALPQFEQLFGVSLELALPVLPVVLGLLGLSLVVTLAAGFYPGWFLSSFRPATVLKGTTQTGNRQTVSLRQGLIVFQFVLSVGLLCSTIFIRQQLDYLQSKNLGFDKEHVMLMRINNPEMYNNRELFRERMLREPGVEALSYMSGPPGGFHDATTVQLPELNQDMRLRTAFVDFDYPSLMGLQIVAGRDFNPSLARDSTRAALVNERAAADLGVSPDELIGKKIWLASFDSLARTIVGVVANYHFASLHEGIEPMVIATGFGGRNIAIKAQAERLPAVIAAAEAAWNDYAPAFPFTFEFLDERLDRLYQSEERQGRIFSLFSGIAIFIACLGMFGLAAFAASTRTKEVGIRKVLGASVSSIIGLLSAGFLKLVVIALVIAVPLVWLFIQDWLQNFAYRIDLEWWVFLIAGTAALLIAFLTVSAQSLKTALTNPVNSLRSE